MTSEDVNKQAGKTLLIEGVIPPAHPPKGKAPQVIRVEALKPTSDNGG